MTKNINHQNGNYFFTYKNFFYPLKTITLTHRKINTTKALSNLKKDCLKKFFQINKINLKLKFIKQNQYKIFVVFQEL